MKMRKRNIQNQKFKIKLLCFLAVFLSSTVSVLANEEVSLFGSESLFEAGEETIENVTPAWFDNQAPWTAPKTRFNGENFIVSSDKLYRRRADISEWQEITPNWGHFFTQKITALETFNGKLYLGTYSRAWAEIWESVDGVTWENITPIEKHKIIHTDPEGNEIQIVGAPNFEIVPTMWGGSYFEVSFLQEFNGYLYAGLASGTGAKIVRFNNSSWEEITPEWSRQNVNIKAATVFKGELLIGTYNLDGAQLWKLGCEGNWSQLAFGGAEGIRINALEVFEPVKNDDSVDLNVVGALYIGLFDGKGKSEIIKTSDFNEFILATPQKWQEFSQFEIINLGVVGNVFLAEILVNKARVEIWGFENNAWYKIEETLSAKEEKGSILDIFIEKVKQALVKLGILIKEGIVWIERLFVKEAVVEKAKIKEAEIERARLNKVEMVDQTTDEIYCIWIENGGWVKIKGACGFSQAGTGEGADLQGSTAGSLEPLIDADEEPTPAPAPVPEEPAVEEPVEAEPVLEGDVPQTESESLEPSLEPAEANSEDEPTPELVPEQEPAPESEPAHEPAVEPISEPAPEPVPEPAPELMPAPASAPDGATAGEPAPEAAE